MTAQPLPTQIAGIAVPSDEVSVVTWLHAQRVLPRYLLNHSVRSYCWGATIGVGEGWTFDRQVLWTASLLHDQGLTSLPRNATASRSPGERVPDAGSSVQGWRPTRRRSSSA